MQSSSKRSQTLWVPALCGCAGHRRIEIRLRRRPRADCQRAGNIRTMNITGRSPESSGTSHGNVASHTRGVTSFTLPQITSGGAITWTAGRTKGRHGAIWKERLAAARNAAAGAVRAPAPVSDTLPRQAASGRGLGTPTLACMAAPGGRQQEVNGNQYVASRCLCTPNVVGCRRL